jgi:DNA polymerase-3 subunit epsilon
MLSGSRAAQVSFDELGTPLSEVTFVVLDLETTGTSPAECEITEVGAMKYRAGECLGTFQTLVNPGVPIPRYITVLTGITEAMLVPAPPIGEVLPPLLEFIGGAVIVGHNVGFDTRFLNAALVRAGYERLGHRIVDTLGLARRLVRDEVPDLRLATLARHFRVAAEPCHRALDDARATAEVLHGLLERAGTLGVLGLDDLLELPTIRAHPSAGKLRLTARLPRLPGVYMFKDRAGRVLYVGKATNLRSRVRSYFGSDDRRKVPQLLRETQSIDWTVCADDLEASVREARLIRELEPRFNRLGKGWRSYAYLKLTLDERFPRLSVVRRMRDDGALYVGPLHSAAAAQRLRDAIESASRIRRCPKRVSKKAVIECGTACTPAQLGVACCPCRGVTTEAEYADVVAQVVRGLTVEPRALLDPLEQRMHGLAGDERFEEAALARDRLALLTRVLARQQDLDWLTASGKMHIGTERGVVTLRHGLLDLDDGTLPQPLESAAVRSDRRYHDELRVVARWLETEISTGRARLLEVSGAPALPLGCALPSYEPVSRRGIRRGR